MKRGWEGQDRSSRIEAIVGVALLFLFLVALWQATALAAPRPKTVTKVTPSPDVTIVWRNYPVGGFVMCNPVADSTGQHQCFVIPKGSVLVVPEAVVDSAGAQQKEHMRKEGS